MFNVDLVSEELILDLVGHDTADIEAIVNLILLPGEHNFVGGDIGNLKSAHDRNLNFNCREFDRLEIHKAFNINRGHLECVFSVCKQAICLEFELIVDLVGTSKHRSRHGRGNIVRVFDSVLFDSISSYLNRGEVDRHGLVG